jgi:outer membrane protein TolC
MKTLVFLIFNGLIFAVYGTPPDTLTIRACLKAAGERTTILRHKDLTSEAFANRRKNLAAHWYPAVGFNGQAQYNSETIDFSDLGLPVSMPSLPLDQYKIWADIQQQLYDGGLVRAQKAVEKAGYESEIMGIEAELLKTKQQVCQTYFSILLAQESATVLKVSLEELEAKKKVIGAGIEHGAVLPEAMLALEAEEIKMQQRLSELQLSCDCLIGVLSILTDSAMQPGMVFEVPQVWVIPEPTINRPELAMFDLQQKRLQAGQKLIRAGDYPKVFAYSQLAYGRPGYNMISNDFHSFYSVGLGLKWNFLHYGNSRRQIRNLEIQKDAIDIEKENFKDQLNIQLNNENTNMVKYDEWSRQDEKILELRKSIAQASLARLLAGVITPTDYLSDMNAEVIARLQVESHRIMKLQALYNYRIMLGAL